MLFNAIRDEQAVVVVDARSLPRAVQVLTDEQGQPKVFLHPTDAAQAAERAWGETASYSLEARRWMHGHRN